MRLDIQHQGPIPGVQAGDSERVPLHPEQPHHGQADGVGPAGAAQGKQSAQRPALTPLPVLLGVETGVTGRRMGDYAVANLAAADPADSLVRQAIPW